MARRPRVSQRADLITTITDTIASHPRLSAAAAFQMGVLLGQAMSNRDATLKAIKRGVGGAPTAIASMLPNFGFFDSASKPQARRTRKTSRRKRRKAA